MLFDTPLPLNTFRSRYDVIWHHVKRPIGEPFTEVPGAYGCNFGMQLRPWKKIPHFGKTKKKKKREKKSRCSLLCFCKPTLPLPRPRTTTRVYRSACVKRTLSIFRKCMISTELHYHTANRNTSKPIKDFDLSRFRWLLFFFSSSQQNLETDLFYLFFRSHVWDHTSYTICISKCNNYNDHYYNINSIKRWAKDLG